MPIIERIKQLSRRQKITLGIGALILVILILFPKSEETKKKPSPQEEFSVEYIVYSAEEQGYLVKLKALDSPKVREEVNQWFKNKGLAPAANQIRYLTLEDQAMINKIALSLPIQAPEYDIAYSSRTNSFLITLKPPFEENRRKSLSWLMDQGFSDTSKAYLLFAEYQPHGSVGSLRPY